MGRLVVPSEKRHFFHYFKQHFEHIDGIEKPFKSFSFSAEATFGCIILLLRGAAPDQKHVIGFYKLVIEPLVFGSLELEVRLNEVIPFLIINQEQVADR